MVKRNTGFVSEPPEPFWYLAPILTCACGNWIELPYSNLAQTDEAGVRLLRGEDPPERPRKNGSQCSYAVCAGAQERTLTGRWKRSQFRSCQKGYTSLAKVFFRVRFPCGENIAKLLSKCT